MDTSASPRIRLLAIIAGIAALAAAGGMFFMSRAGTGDAAAQPLPPPAVITTTPASATPAPAETTEAPAKVAPKAKVPAKPKAAGKPKATPEPKAKPKPKPKPRVIAANGLPMAVATQLARHGLVVVALHAESSSVDRMARDEAEAGASDAGVGFAAIDVSDGRAMDALTRKVEVVDAPAVLVFDRDGEPVARFDGFADRMIVAQLAASAQ